MYRDPDTGAVLDYNPDINQGMYFDAAGNKIDPNTVGYNIWDHPDTIYMPAQDGSGQLWTLRQAQQYAAQFQGGGDFITNFLDNTNLPRLLGGVFTGGAVGGFLDPYSLEAGAGVGMGSQLGGIGDVGGDLGNIGAGLETYGGGYFGSSPSDFADAPYANTDTGPALAPDQPLSPLSTPAFPNGIPAGTTLEELMKAVGGPATAVGSALSRLLSGNGTAADYASVLGTLGATGLGYLGSQAQTAAYKEAADKYLGMGAPFRSLLEQSYQPGFDINKEPGYQGALDTSTNSFLRAASAGRAPGVSGGNPFDNPGAWAETMKYVTANTALPYLENYRNTLAGAGQLGVSQAAPASLGGAAAGGGTYNALGYGLNQLANPQPTLTDLLKQYAQIQNAYRPTGGFGL